MLFLNIFEDIIIVLGLGIVVLVGCSTYEESKRDDKLVLNPVELIDLVREEQRQATDNPGFDSITKNTADFSVQEYSKSATTGDEEDDVESLNLRKVWSRWTKWSKCSVSCGPGTISRKRLCVSGRCAPGEHEEQRRTCERAPCELGPATDAAAAGAGALADELHDDAE